MARKINKTPYEARSLAMCALHDERITLSDEALVSLYRTALDGWVPDTVMNYRSGFMHLHRPNAEVIRTVMPNMKPENAAYVARRIDDPLLAEMAWRTRKGKKMARSLALSDGIAPPLAEKLLEYCRKNFDADVVVALLRRNLVPLEKVLEVLAEDPIRIYEYVRDEGSGTVGSSLVSSIAGDTELENLVMSVDLPSNQQAMAELLLQSASAERRRELLALVPSPRTRVSLLSALDDRLGVEYVEMILSVNDAGSVDYGTAPHDLRFDSDAQALLAKSPRTAIVRMLLCDSELSKDTLMSLVNHFVRGSFADSMFEMLLERLLENPEIEHEAIEKLMVRWQVSPAVSWHSKTGSFPEPVKQWLARHSANAPDQTASMELLSTLLPDWEGTALELRDTVASLS